MGPGKCAQTIGISYSLATLRLSRVQFFPRSLPTRICQRSWGQRANVDSPDKNQHQGENHVSLQSNKGGIEKPRGFVPSFCRFPPKVRFKIVCLSLSSSHVAHHSLSLDFTMIIL